MEIKKESFKIPISTILLVPLVFVFLDKRVAPLETVNVWVTLATLLYVVVAILSENSFLLPKLWAKIKWLGKLFTMFKFGLLFWLLLMLVFLPFMTEVTSRLKDPANYNIKQAHDGLIQTEAAVQKLLQGKNPYSETYFDTPLAEWHYSNPNSPSLFHYVYFPFYFLSEVPFYLIVKNAVGSFDGRIIFFIAQLGILIMLPFCARKEDNKLSLLILYFINPLTTYSFIWGHAEVFVFFWILLAVMFLIWKKPKLSQITLALACGLKPTAWFLLPFYFAYTLQGDYSWKNIRKTAINFWPFALTILLIFLPFVVWNPGAFFASTIGYLSGTAENSFVMLGMGISNLIGKYIGTKAYFPFWALQLGLGLPLLAFLFWKMRKIFTLPFMLASFSIFTFVFLFVSRYALPSHFYLVFWILLLAFFLTTDDSRQT